MDSNSPTGSGKADLRRYALATMRNRDPILDVLRKVLPSEGRVLEVASGTGEHACHFARHMPGLSWQPSDPDENALISIAAWREASDLPNLLPPIALDAAAEDWPIAHADAMLCINMTHISPWKATEGLMRGAGELLPRGAPLVLYGPFRRIGHALQPSNAAFDADLRQRNPAWGLRLLEQVSQCAAMNDLAVVRAYPMPANNLTVVYRRR